MAYGACPATSELGGHGRVVSDPATVIRGRDGEMRDAAILGFYPVPTRQNCGADPRDSPMGQLDFGDFAAMDYAVG